MAMPTATILAQAHETMLLSPARTETLLDGGVQWDTPRIVIGCCLLPSSRQHAAYSSSRTVESLGRSRGLTARTYVVDVSAPLRTIRPTMELLLGDVREDAGEAAGASAENAASTDAGDEASANHDASSGAGDEASANHDASTGAGDEASANHDAGTGAGGSARAGSGAREDGHENRDAEGGEDDCRSAGSAQHVGGPNAESSVDESSDGSDQGNSDDDNEGVLLINDDLLLSLERNVQGSESIAAVVPPADVDAIVRLFFDPTKAPSCSSSSGGDCGGGGAMTLKRSCAQVLRSTARFDAASPAARAIVSSVARSYLSCTNQCHFENIARCLFELRVFAVPAVRAQADPPVTAMPPYALLYSFFSYVGAASNCVLLEHKPPAVRARVGDMFSRFLYDWRALMAQAARLPEMDACPSLRALVLHFDTLFAAGVSSMRAREHLRHLMDGCFDFISRVPTVVRGE